jgi:hypothetical protein
MDGEESVQCYIHQIWSGRRNVQYMEEKELHLLLQTLVLIPQTGGIF